MYMYIYIYIIIRRPLRGHQAARREVHSHSATVSHGSFWSFCVHLCSYRLLYCVPQVLRSSSLICSMLSAGCRQLTECTVRPQNTSRYHLLAGFSQLRAPLKRIQYRGSTTFHPKGAFFSPLAPFVPLLLSFWLFGTRFGPHFGSFRVSKT